MKVVSVWSFEQKFRKIEHGTKKQFTTDYATPTRFVQKNQSALFWQPRFSPFVFTTKNPTLFDTEGFDTVVPFFLLLLH